MGYNATLGFTHECKCKPPAVKVECTNLRETNINIVILIYEIWL